MSFDEDIRSFEVSEEELGTYFYQEDRNRFVHLDSLIVSGDKKSFVSYMNQHSISERTFRNIPVSEEQCSPLIAAVIHGRYEITKYLLENGLDFRHPQEIHPVHEAASRGHLSLVQLLAGYGYSLDDPDSYGSTPLHHAGLANREVVIRFLLEAGCNVNHVNVEGYTILHRLIQAGASIDILECLFSKGFSKINFSDFKGCTPLYWSLKCKRELQVITFLLSKGASAMMNTKQQISSFQIAVSSTNDVNILRALYSAGASPEYSAHGMRSPLDIAVRKKKLNYVRILVKEFNVLLKTGHSDAFMIALKVKSLDIALFLLKAGHYVTYSQRLWFQQNVEDLEGFNPDAKVKIKALSSLMSNPRSLCDICSMFVRRRLGQDVFNKSQRLQIPSILVDHIQLEHL